MSRFFSMLTASLLTVIPFQPSLLAQEDYSGAVTRAIVALNDETNALGKYFINGRRGVSQHASKDEFGQ